MIKLLFKYHSKILCVFIISIVFTSCTKKYIEFPEANTSISYKDNIQPIFNNSCINCHNQQANTFNLKTGYSYKSLLNNNLIDIDKPSKSVLLIKINNNHPYEEAVNTYEYNLIDKWITEGANDN